MRYPVCKHKSHARRESFVGTRVITRDHECLRVFTCVGRVVRSRICRIFWDFQDGGGPADAGGLVRALDESLRAFTRDHERLRVLGGLSGAGFAGFIGIFRMGEDLLTQVGSDERLRAFTRDHERLRVFTCVGRIGWSRICRIFGIFRIGEDLLTQVGSDERWTSVCECLRVLGGLGGAGFAGLFGIFGMAGVPPALVRWYERWTRVCERLREITRVCKRLDAFTRDWYGWPVWVDNEMGKIRCMDTDAGCFVQSMRGSSVGVRWSGL